MKRRNRNKNRKLRKLRRKLRFESLEARQMLAVSPWTIDLSGSGSGSGSEGMDLFGDDIGGVLQGGFTTSGPGSGGTVMTSNVPGQNNLPPSAVDDTPASGNPPQVSANDGPTDITAVLLSNDSDPDARDTLAVSGVSGPADLKGELTWDEATGQVMYDPNGQFASLPDGAIGTDTFDYTITDRQGATDTATATVQVTGVNDPPAIVGAATVIVNLGETATNAGLFLDPDTGDSAQLSASHGTVTDNGDGTWSWSLDTPDEADESQQVTITATDTNGAQSGMDFDLVVNYFTPDITVDSAEIRVVEGQIAANSGTFPEPDADGLTLTASAGSLVPNANGTWNWSAGTSDGPDQSQEITITARDGGGGITSATFDLVVLNAAPSLTVDKDEVEVDEGETATNSGTFFDPGVDSVSLSASVGTVSGNSDGTWTWAAGTSNGPAQSQTVTITIEDSDGDATSTSFDLIVNNVAPTVTVDNPVVEVDEGQTATNSGTFFDPGSEALTLNASAGSLTAAADGTWSWSAAASDGPVQSQTVTITFEDGDGATGSTSFDLIVNNVAPTVTVENAEVEVDEGQTATNSGTFFEPGSDSLTLSASAGSLSAAADGTWSWSAATSDGPVQSQTVTITFEDSDGATGSTSFDLIVNNVAPSVTSDNATVEVDEGQTATNSGTFFDPGAEELTLTASAGSLSAADDGTWSWSAATSDGPVQSQTVTITFEDSDGATGSTSFDLIVNNVAPSVTSDNETVEVIEGQTATNSGTFFDPGSDGLELAASIGTISAGEGAWNWAFNTNDGPHDSQEVTITATDSDGAQSSVSFDLTVDNVAPTVSVDNSTVAVVEGQTAENSGGFGDAGDDAVTLTASRGTVVDNGDGTWSWSSNTDDGPDDSQQVTITATDSDGAQSSVSFTLTVNNAAADIGADQQTVVVDEGGQAANTGTYNDPGDDSVALSASAGAVVDNGDGTWSWSLDSSDGPDDSQQVTITATDSDGAQSNVSFTLTVENVAPTVAADNETAMVDEGQTATNTGTFSDPGADGVTLSASTGTVVDNGDGTWNWSFDSADGPDQSDTVTVTATDSDGAFNSTTFALVVDNVAPSVAADNDTVTVGEGQSAANTGTFSDAGADVVTLTASVGEISDNGDGTWSWSFDTTDGPDQSDTVTITATDSDGAFTTATFALVVNNVAPSVAADSDTVTVDEGQTATNTGTHSDPGADDVALSASSGTVVDNGDGTWSWSSATSDGPAQQQVTITATDSDGAESSIAFDLIVNNVAPSAANHSFAATGNVPIEVALSELLAGVTDPGDDTISLDSVESTSEMGGTIVLDGEGSSFIYTPPAGFQGTDSFQYTVADEDGDTGSGTVTIDVVGTIWFVDNSVVENGDGTLNSPFASFAPINTGGSADADGDSGDDAGDVIFVFTGDETYDVTHGDPEVHDHGFLLEDGQILIGQGVTGESLEEVLAGFTIDVASDGQALPEINGDKPHLTNTSGDVITVTNNNTITGVMLDPVASAGIAGDDVSGLTIELVVIITSGGTNNNEGVDISGATGTLTITNVQIESEEGGSNDGTGIKITGGTASFSFENVDLNQLGGSLIQIVGTDGSSIDFDENSSLTLAGSDDVAVQITGNSDGTVTLNVPDSGLSFDLSGNEGTQTSTPVNDAPWFTIDDVVTVRENGPLDGATPITIADFATGIAVGPQDEIDDGQTIEGFTVTVDSNEDFELNEDLFAKDENGNPIIAIDNDGNLSFTPTAGAEGSALIKVELMDSGGTDNGGADTAVDKFVISIPVNDPPSFTIAANPPAAAEDSGEQTVVGFAGSISVGPQDEVDAGQSILGFHVTGNTNPGLFAAGPAIDSDGNLTYTPAANANGTATITVELQDDGGTFNGGDDTSDSHTFTIEVTPVNDAPDFTIPGQAPESFEDQGAQTVASFATNISPGPADEAGQTLTFHITNNTNPGLFLAQPEIAADGTLAYETNPDAHGTAQITLHLQDDGGTENGGSDMSNTETFSIIVTPVNDPPSLSPIGDKSVNELSQLAFTVGATDPDLPADSLTFNLDGAPAGASITGNQFTWTPTEAEGPGIYTFDVVVTDSGNPQLEDRETITVTVDEVNQSPVLDPIGDKFVAEGQPLTFNAAASDPDQPANTLTFSLAGQPAGASITADGQFTWTPTHQQSGLHTLDVVVTDNGNPQLEDRETITVNVADVNLPPVLDPIGNKFVAEGQPLMFDATASDPDQPADTLVFSLAGEPAGAAITPGGQITWTPSEAQGPGLFSFDVVVTDSGNPQLADSETITVDVGEVNQAPLLDPIANQTVDVGQNVSFAAMANDPDLPADTLSFGLTGNVPAGASIDPNSGQFNWTPTDQQVGSFTFDVVVTDNGQPQMGDSQAVTLAVEDVADPNDDELFTSSILDFARAELEGQTFTFGYFEFEAYGDAVSEDTIIYAQGPNDNSFQPIGDGWGWGEIEFEQGDGQSFADFIAPFNGDWTLLVDFNDNFLDAGQEADDGVYHISFDLSNVDEATFFPQATEVDSVTPDAADPRRSTIEWTQNPEADFMLAIASLGDNPVDGVEVFGDEVPADQTSLTTSFLPADSVMTAILGAGFDAGNLATQDGQDAVALDELGVFATTFRTLGFTTDPLVTESVPAGNASGDHAGGSDTTGGVDFSFSGVNSAAEFSSEFFTTREHEFLSVLLGGEQAVQEMYDTVAITGDTLQVWDFNLEDASGPVGFSSATITVGYDESLFGFDGFDATPADVEDNLAVFHPNPDTGQWELMPTVSHDTVNDTITFEADSFSPFVLGQDFDEPNDPPQDNNYSAEIWAGVAEFVEGDGPAGQFAFVEFELNGEDAPVGPDTRVFAQLPGDSTYHEFDGWYWEDDHDFDPTTPAIKHAGFDFEVEQGGDDLAAFHNSLDGTWTVLVDTDGDFDPNNPNEEPDDAKFTVDFDASNLNQLPPAPTITSPADGAAVDGSDGVTIVWDVAPGSMDGVEVEAEVFNEDENLYFEDLAVNGQSAMTPELPSDTPFEAEVLHVDGSGDFAGNAIAVDGFGAINFDPTTSFFVSGHATSFMTEPADFAEFELSLERIEFDSETIWHQGYLDVFTFDPRHNEDTTLWLKQPTDADFVQQSVGFDGIALDFEQDVEGGQTFAEFAASLSGTWEVGVDFDGETDGNDDFDEQFSVTVDLSGFTEASFLDATTINSPTGTLAPGQRTATIAWDPVTGTDFYIVGVDGSFDTDVPAGTTSFEAQWLPTGGELLAFVGAADERGDLVTLGDGDPPIDASFYTPTFVPSFFEIPTLTVAVPAGNSEGTFASGAGVLGGTDYGLKIVETAANFKAEYFATGDYDGQMNLVGEEAQQEIFEFEHPGEVLQIWQVELADDEGGEVGFGFADLTFSYDQSLLDQPWSDLTPEELEQHLYLYQFNPEAESWQHVQLTGRDSESNTISVRTGDLSPFVLGYDPQGPGVEPVDDSPIASVDIELIQADFEGEQFKQLSLEIETHDPRAEEATVLYVTTPLDDSPQAFADSWGNQWIGIEAEGGQSLDDFIASIEGDYDFEFDFDGDSVIDDDFTISLDLATVDSTLFPSETTPTSPVDGSLLPIDQRRLTIEWEENESADFMDMEVGSNDLDAYFFDAEVDATTTSVQTGLLPSGIGLEVFLGGLVNASEFSAQTGGSDVADYRFGLGTFTVTSFEIAEQTKAVSPAEPSGVYGGGDEVVGGLDFTFTGLAGHANFKAEYLPATDYDQRRFAAGNDPDALDALWDFNHTSENVLQVWHLGLLDDAGAGVEFDHVDLAIHYDESLIDWPDNTLEEIEDHLLAYQFDPVSGEWLPLETLARRPWDDVLTVRATNTDSPIVLGYDMTAADAPWQPAGQIGEAEMEIYRIESADDDPFYIGNIEFQAYDENVEQDSRIEVLRPGDATFTPFDDEFAYGFIGEQFTSLADLVASNDGTYTVRVDYENDGTHDYEFTVTYDLSGLIDDTLPDAPNITSPTPGTIVTADDPSVLFTWDVQPDADGTYGIVHIANGDGVDDNEEVFETALAETTTSFVADNLPTDEILMGGVAATQTHHHRTSHASANGSIQTELELVTFSTVFFGGAPLHAAGGQGPGAESITAAQLTPIVDEAIQRLTTAGLTESQAALLESTEVQIADLPDGMLGIATATGILIDTDAAGHGWFVDPTPADDTEFTSSDSSNQKSKIENQKSIDLLTVLMHEMGHVLGDGHDRGDPHGLMSEDLPEGIRRFPEWHEFHGIDDDLLDLLAHDLANIE